MAGKTTNAVAKDDFLFDHAGEGTEFFGAGTTVTPYLGLVQPDSTLESDECPAGTWRNSATGRCYGKEVDVTVLAFCTVWSEREIDEPYRTVARYKPNTIEVTTTPVGPGKRGYPKMVNPQTGNEIQELYVYALALPDYPEDGVILFSPTVGSMRTCKQWNGALKSQVLSNGQTAPIFGFRWKLKSDLVANPKQPNRKMTRFVAFEKAGLTSKSFFMERVAPTISTIRKEVLALAQGPLEEPLLIEGEE